MEKGISDTLGTSVGTLERHRNVFIGIRYKGGVSFVFYLGSLNAQSS